MLEARRKCFGSLVCLGLMGGLGLLGSGCNKVKELTTAKPIVVAPSGSPVVRELQEADYPGLVATPGRLTVVVFHATWCGPCRQLAPVMGKVANEFSGVAQVGRFDVDQCPNISRQLGVSSIPDVRFFINGKQVDSFIGGLAESDVREKFKACSRGLVAGSATDGMVSTADGASKSGSSIHRMPKD